MPWKDRLYNSYVSSGQASTGRLSSAISADDFFAPRAASIQHIVEKHVPTDRGARILDLACGHGAFLYFLKKAGYTNISGADISQEQIDVAHRLGIPEAKCCNLFSELADTSSESVDVLLLMDVLEHLTMDELFQALDEAFRVLKKGGTCIAHVPNAEGLYGMRIRYGDLTHERAFAPKSAQQIFNAVRFTNVQCFEDRPQPHGAVSFIRRVIWEVGTAPHRLLLAAELGDLKFVLSHSMLITATR